MEKTVSDDLSQLCRRLEWEAYPREEWSEQTRRSRQLLLALNALENYTNWDDVALREHAVSVLNDVIELGNDR